MVHRVIYGSLERFIGVLVEHFGGKFPLWLSPVQVRLLNVTDRNLKYCRQLEKKMKKKGIRVELDDRNETISKKVRTAQVEKVPIILVVGDKEEQSKTVAVRTLKGEVKYNVQVNELIKQILKNIQKRELDISFK